MVKLNYFNLLSWLDGTTCYCPSCTKDRFSFFTTEETTEVVETVSSGLVEQLFDSFKEISSELLNQPLFMLLITFGFILLSFNLVLKIFRSLINRE